MVAASQKLMSLVGVANLATRAASSRPYRCGGNYESTATNAVHPHSFAFAQQLPQRGSRGGCAAAGGFEPPLRFVWRSMVHSTDGSVPEPGGSTYS